MPELPEVETTCRGITPHIHQQTIVQVIVRQPRLRWPIPTSLTSDLPTQRIENITRRGKYLLLYTTKGTIIIHLGMSGNLRILPSKTVAQKHDHIDIIFANDLCLRFNDPRRFGCVLWTEDNPVEHTLLKKLGPEPLSTDFNGAYLFRISRKHHTAIKNFIMNSQIVVGVGNIYANEALFQAGIHPKRAATRITAEQYERLAKVIKKILTASIKQGGTTLRNFITSDGKPGYFKQRLKVYGRGKLPCLTCTTPLREIRLGQRATVFCPKCQKMLSF